MPSLSYKNFCLTHHPQIFCFLGNVVQGELVAIPQAHGREALVPNEDVLAEQVGGEGQRGKFSGRVVDGAAPSLLLHGDLYERLSDA